MLIQRIPALLTSVILLLTACATPPATIRLVVNSPPGTDSVTVAGNHQLLGDWNPAAIAMDRHQPGEFSIELRLPVGTELEYKFTRGSWHTEALDSAGNIPGNYQFCVTGDTTISHRVSAWRDATSSDGSGITGTVSYHRDFYSPQLENHRDLLVWLPPSYESQPDSHYAVLYLQDGQNIFNPATSYTGVDWQVDEAASRLMAENRIHEVIIVGIANTHDRHAEYSPGEKGLTYSAFLINTVKPFIENNYRIASGPRNTAVMGSSMGGLISFHLAWEYPESFGLAGCLSPAFLVDRKAIVHRVQSHRGARPPIRLYIDNGTIGLEQRLQPATDAMITALCQQGFSTGQNLIYRQWEGAEHNEAAWAERVPAILEYFFGSNDPNSSNR